MSRVIGGVILLALLVPTATRAVPESPDVPKGIALPPGHKLLFRREANGVQIYKAVERTPGVLEWVLEGPLAELFDDKGTRAGWHYEGPAWEAADGSKVVRDKAEEVKSAPAPRPKDDIPWLLVKVKAEGDREGVFSSAVYVHRVQTSGGKAPTEAPRRAGTKIGVPYKAVYLFYQKMK